MGRRRAYVRLTVLMNNRLVGHLTKEMHGSITFSYDPFWLRWEHAMPISLSLPLREDPYKGAAVSSVFENLLPDSDTMRRHMAERLGADGIDAYSLLAKIGRDCVGALQFIPEGVSIKPKHEIQGTVVDEDDIEKMLLNLGRFPLGLDLESDFRISLAGVQEKTALLFKDNQWIKPTGTTPTTHILKTQIGHLPGGIDLSNSIENEFYCLKILEAFNLPVNQAHIQTFGKTKALVIERFDRLWTDDGRLIRLPQEDFCQALSVPPTRKYQNQGGPGIHDIMRLLRGSDEALEDQQKFFKCQILFWLLGATDGHAKNFSIFLAPGSGYKLTPFYDVLTVQPSISARHIEMKKVKLAMSVSQACHYKIEDIHRRHFFQTGERAGLSKSVIDKIIQDIIDQTPAVFKKIEGFLPPGFPQSIHKSVKAAYKKRMKFLTV